MSSRRSPSYAVRLASLISLVCASAVLAPRGAQAAADAADSAASTAPGGVKWDPRWPRFQLWEYGGTAALGVTAWYLDRNQLPPEQPKTQGGVLFDDAAREWLRAETPQGRARANKVSNWLWFGGSIMPFVVDLPVVLLAHRQPGIAWQLLMMDLEAYAVAGVLNRTLHFSVGRGRPDLADCAANPGYDELCGSRSNNASFPSGHTLGVATAAGLTCVHHRYLPLYGSPIADGSVCGLMTVATLATAATRVMADRHHSTDVLAGALIGFASGYGVPWLLHYRHGATASERSSRSPRSTLVPFAGTTEVGLGLVGTL